MGTALVVLVDVACRIKILYFKRSEESEECNEFVFKNKHKMEIYLKVIGQTMKVFT